MAQSHGGPNSWAPASKAPQACTHSSSTPELVQKDELKQVQPAEAEGVSHQQQQQQQQQHGKQYTRDPVIYTLLDAPAEGEIGKRGHEDGGSAGDLKKIDTHPQRSDGRSPFQKALLPDGVGIGVEGGTLVEWKAQKPDEELGNKWSSSSITISSNSSLSLCPTRQPSATTGVYNPAVQKALKEAVKARQTQPRQYVSRLEDAGGNQTQHFVQAACRFAVKVNGHHLPETVPQSSTAQLQHRLSRYQRLMPAVQTAVRTGCLVISYAATASQICGLEDLCADTLAVAKDWAHEHGLLEAGQESMLSVQACHLFAWGITQLEQPSSSYRYSMALHTPFLIVSPSSEDMQASLQQHMQAELELPVSSPEHKASCQFELTIAAPPHFELRGWQGAADAPEELPDDVKDHSLCLLASMDGQFVCTSVEQRSMASNGERVAQARVSLPVSSLDAAASCPEVVVLELWAAGSLVCSYSAVLLSSCYSGALAELQGVGREALFVRDLVHWAHFLAVSRSAQQQQLLHLQQQGEAAATDTADPLAAEEPTEQQLGLMAGVGMDLLEHCLVEGMVAVAELLMDEFTQAPFYFSPADLLVGAAAPTTASRHDSSFMGTCGASTFSSMFAATSATAADGDDAPVPTTALQADPAAEGKAASTDMEARYRAWMNAQVASLAKGWCSVVAFNIGMGTLRAALMEGTRLHEELASWGTMVIGYAVGALCIQPKPYSSSLSSSSPSSKINLTNEVVLAGVSVARGCFCFLVGLGLLPLSPSVKLFLRWRMDAIIEVVMMSVMEQVRLRWMLPLRLFLLVGFGLWYARLGFSYPWVQSTLINASSLAVSAAMDVRYRRLFAQARLKGMQAGLGSAHQSQSPEAESRGHSKKMA